MEKSEKIMKNLQHKLKLHIKKKDQMLEDHWQKVGEAYLEMKNGNNNISSNIMKYKKQKLMQKNWQELI